MQLAQTCQRVHAVSRENATWKRFLEVYEYPEYEDVPACAAKEMALKHYCRSCDCKCYQHAVAALY